MIITAIMTYDFYFQTRVAVPTDLRTNRLYIQIYILWMKMIFIELIPYGVISVLNVWMAIE